MVQFIAKVCPSGDHSPLGQLSAPIFRGGRPSTPMMYMPVSVTSAICEPSGEMNGYQTTVGGQVSCWRSLPSVRLRHNVDSGHVRYAIHFPSRENVTSFTD